MLPRDDAPITLSEIESEDGVVYVSGMQGLIATMFMAEDLNQPRGENNPKPVCIVAELATPMDFFMPRVIIQN